MAGMLMLQRALLPNSPLHHFLPPETSNSHGFCCYISVTISISLNKMFMPLASDASGLPTKPFAVDFLPQKLRIWLLPCPFWGNDTTQPTWASVSTFINENHNSIYLIRLLLGLNKYSHVKPLNRALLISKGDMLAIVVIIIIIIFGFCISYLCNFQSQADLHSLFFPTLQPQSLGLTCEHDVCELLRTASLGGTAAGEKGQPGRQGERSRLQPGLSHHCFVYLPKQWPNFLSMHRFLYLPNI